MSKSHVHTHGDCIRFRNIPGCCREPWSPKKETLEHREEEEGPSYNPGYKKLGGEKLGENQVRELTTVSQSALLMVHASQEAR